MPVLGTVEEEEEVDTSGRDRASEGLSASVGYSGGMNIMEDRVESYV